MPKKERYLGKKVACKEHPGRTVQSTIGEVIIRQKVYRRFKRRCTVCSWSKEVDVYLRKASGSQ